MDTFLIINPINIKVVLLISVIELCHLRFVRVGVPHWIKMYDFSLESCANGAAYRLLLMYIALNYAQVPTFVTNVAFFCRKIGYLKIFLVLEF